MALTYKDKNDTLLTVPQPNLFTAIGALCLDSTIRREFFHPITPPVQDVFMNLAEVEFQACMSLAAKDPSYPPESDYAAVGAFYCRKQPCPYAIANIETVVGTAVIDKTFRAVWLKNPHQAHLDYGFDLLEEEDAILVAHVARHKEDIKTVMEVLGNKLNGILPVAQLLTTSEVAIAKSKTKAKAA